MGGGRLELQLNFPQCTQQLTSPSQEETTQSQGFPGSLVVKNTPANAGDTGSIPGPGRSHMPWSNQVCEPQLLSLCHQARNPQLLKPVCPAACAPQEKPLQREARAPQVESGTRSPPLAAVRESPCTAMKAQSSQINR